MSVLFNYWHVPATGTQQIDVENLSGDEAGEVLGPAMEEEGFDLDRGWDIVHYLLTGQQKEDASPLSIAIHGKCAADEDGECKYSPPGVVKDVAAALGEISRDEIGRRYEPAVMQRARVYDSEILDEDNRDEYLEMIEELTAFYQEAADQGMGVLIGIG